VSGWAGGDITPAASCVLAPNPGPMTLDGTNTWVLSAPDATRAVVVDPGPQDPRHLRAVLTAVEARGARVGVVLLTHGHLDHSEAARSFAEAAGGVGVRALDPAQRLGDEGLGDRDVVDVDGLLVEVVATPGHTGDSLSFVLPDSGALLTGDTVLGRGTTVVAYPDGRLGDYLDSLARLEELVEARGLVDLLPGHGPALSDPLEVVRFYRRHRAERLDQVRAAVDAGARTPREVVERVYADVPREVWPAAELSVRAQLDYLQNPR
jgi:glyoxylase-like metal-dependent hydrolase (beta-lactamase superfamily II)